jgi:hypothetical protein
MGVFDIDLAEKPFTLSAYSIVQSGLSYIAAWDYKAMFKESVYIRAGEFIGADGVIDVIKKIPIEYLHELKHNNQRPILSYLKHYTTKQTKITIKESQNRYTFEFQRSSTSNARLWYGPCLIINVYAR